MDKTLMAVGGAVAVFLGIIAALLLLQAPSSPAPDIASLASFVRYTHDKCENEIFLGKSVDALPGLSAPFYGYDCVIRNDALTSQLIIYSGELEQPLTAVKESLLPAGDLEPLAIGNYSMLYVNNTEKQTFVLCGGCGAGDQIYIITADVLGITEDNILDLLAGDAAPIDTAFETLCGDIQSCSLLIPEKPAEAGREKQWTVVSSGKTANVYFGAEQAFLTGVADVFTFFFDKDARAEAGVEVTRQADGVLCIDNGDEAENHRCVIEEAGSFIYVRSGALIDPDTDQLVNDIRASLQQTGGASV